MQDSRAPVSYKESVFYGRGASYDRGGNEVPKYNDYNRAELPPEQDAKYVNDNQHQYGVSAAVDKVETVDLAPPEPVREPVGEIVSSMDLPSNPSKNSPLNLPSSPQSNLSVVVTPAAPTITPPIISQPVIAPSATSPDPFTKLKTDGKALKSELMPDFEKNTNINNSVKNPNPTTMNWQKTKDNAENKYDAKMLQAEAKAATDEQAMKLQQQADKELVSLPKIEPLAPITPAITPPIIAPIIAPVIVPPVVAPPLVKSNAKPTSNQTSNPNLDKEKFVWPLKGKLLKDYNTDSSKGLVIAGRSGEPVRASSSGVVVHVGTKIKSFGNMIIIQHPDGYVTTYSHLSDITISENDNVVGGQLIGFVGKTGDAKQPQLHFAVRHNTQPIDPVKKLTQ